MKEYEFISGSMVDENLTCAWGEVDTVEHPIGWFDFLETLPGVISAHWEPFNQRTLTKLQFKTKADISMFLLRFG